MLDLLKVLLLFGIGQLFTWTFFTYDLIHKILFDLSGKQAAEAAANVDKYTEEALQYLRDKGCGTVESNKIKLDDISLHVVTAGNKESSKMIVLLHGFPEFWGCYLNIIPFLTKLGYFVVTPDMRGYNKSEKPSGIKEYALSKLTKDVADLIKYYKKGKAVVMAHDWGGVVAYRFAMDYPQLFEKLIILNAPHPVAFFKTIKGSLKQLVMSWYVYFFQLPWIPELLFTMNFKRTSMKMFRFKRKEVKLSELEHNLVASAWIQPNAMTGMINYYRALIRGVDSNTKAKVIEHPVLVVWGENDTAISKAVASEPSLKAKWVPNMQLHFVPNCSHWITHEAPKEIEEHVTKFLTN